MARCTLWYGVRFVYACRLSAVEILVFEVGLDTSIHQMARGLQELGHYCRWHEMIVIFKLVSSSQLSVKFTQNLEAIGR
jgi:hypothetical protein